MEIKMKVIYPHMPNYVIVDDGVIGKKQDGFVERPKIPIEQLTLDQLEEYIAGWSEELRAHHQKKRSQT